LHCTLTVLTGGARPQNHAVHPEVSLPDC